MRLLFASLLISFSAQAAQYFPIEIGIGAEYCQPNREGKKVCEGVSPIHKPVLIEMNSSADQPVSYGYKQLNGTFRNIGFQTQVKITHFENRTMDDIVNLVVVTWDLQNPSVKHMVESEIFVRDPRALNRMNLIGRPIGNAEFFTNVILGIRASQASR